MDRKTSKDLQHAVDILNRRWPRGDGYKYALDSAYGQYALCLEDSRGCGRNLSPRDTTGKVATWISAFMDGLDESDRLWRAKLKAADPLVLPVTIANL